MLSCHLSGIDEWGSIGLESRNEDHSGVVFESNKLSILVRDIPSLRGAVPAVVVAAAVAVADVDIWLPWLGSIIWGTSNVAHPSFFSVTISDDLSFKDPTECCWGILEKKSKDGDGKFWDPWSEFIVEKGEDVWNQSTGKVDDVVGNWNKSGAEAEDVTVPDTNGLSNRSTPLEVPETDECGKERKVASLLLRVPADWSGSNGPSAFSEVTDLKDIELLLNDPKLLVDAVLWSEDK